MTLDIYRGASVIANVEIDESTQFNQAVNGDHAITCNITVANVINFNLDDYIIYNGETYTINTIPAYTKVNNISHKYEIRFEAPIFSLYDEFIQHLGETTFSYLGTALQHLTLLIDAIKEIDSDWELGTVDATDEIFLDYDGDYCQPALVKIADAFKLEYSLAGKVISLSKSVGTNTNVSFAYGEGNGLYSLTRRAIDDKNVVNKVYGFGGSKNIDYQYRNGAKRLVFEDRFLEATTTYRARAGRYVNEEIYPKRTGTVTAISGLVDGLFTITDSSLDFNITDYLQEAISGKVVFTSGELSGSQFEIHKYDNTTKTITLLQLKETDSNILPNTTYAHAVGNTYTLVDINMPTSYIVAAEAKLQAETQAYLNENKVPRVAYELDIDEKFIRDNGISIKAGDKVTIKDSQLGINDLLRITAISYPLVNTDNIKATIANFVPYTLQERLIATAIDTKKEVKQVYRGNAEEARRQSVNLRSLQGLVFDGDGYFNGENIRPLSVSTAMLTVGAKSENFNLSEVVLKPNLGGNANTLSISNGKLIHFDIEIVGAGFTWVMTGGTFSSLTSASAYYVYAKCSKGALTGSFVVSTFQIKTEDVSGFYHFKMGVLFPVNSDGYRDFEFTKGMSYLVGDTLTTGRIKSIDAQSYFDLTNNKFKIGDSSTGLDWNDTNPGKLTIRGGLVQNAGGTSAPIAVFRGDYANNVVYYPGDEIVYSGSSYIYKVGATPAQGNLPTNTTYWTVKAIKGADGSSVKILGTKATTGDLPASGNTIGDGWMVSGFLWTWTGTEWVNVGQIKGDKGDTGDTGPTGATGNTGATGSQGIPGTPGADGVVLYTWVRYADNSSGGGLSSSPTGKAYIGFAYNKTSPTPSNVAGDYTFALFKGDQGVAGSTGANGATLYTWIKYADDASGAGLSDDPTGKTYIGIAPNKTTSGEITTPSDYTFAKIKGDAGSQGISAKRILYNVNSTPDTAPSVENDDAPTGWGDILPNADDNVYLADNLGNIITDNAGNTISVDLVPQYVWQIVEVTDVNGNWTGWSVPVRITARAAQDVEFTEFRFAKNGSPTAAPSIVSNSFAPNGWSVTEPSVGALEYLWRVSTVKTKKALSTNWGAPQRFTPIDGVNGIDGIDGIDGEDGANGIQGPYILGRGEWSGTKTYYGLSTRVEVVKYSDIWYVTRVDAGTIPIGTLPTNTTYFNDFGGQFESIATDVLFAVFGYIENAGIRNLKTSETGKRVEILGEDNSLGFYDSSGKKVIFIDDDSAIDDGTFESTFTFYDWNGNPNWISSREELGIIYYTYQIKRAGISVGYGVNDTDGLSSISSKEIFTTGKFETSNTLGTQKTTISKTLIETTGDIKGVNLNATGLTRLNGNSFYLTDGTDFFKVSMSSINGEQVLTWAID